MLRRWVPFSCSIGKPGCAAGAGVPTFLLHRQAGTARRDDGLTACSPGGRFQRFTPRRVSSAARRGAGPPVCCHRRRRLCAAPRGVQEGVRRERGFPRSSCIGRRGLRGGTMVWRHAVREGVFSALRRAVCCVVTEPAGRCGYFSFSAYRRRQRKVPGKEARHSYFFERGSLQLDKSCRKETRTAAFLSASQSPKGKKSRPKERSWLPQARGNVVLVHPAFGERGAAPRAPQSGAQGAAGSEASEA